MSCSSGCTCALEWLRHVCAEAAEARVLCCSRGRELWLAGRCMRCYAGKVWSGYAWGYEVWGRGVGPGKGWPMSSMTC